MDTPKDFIDRLQALEANVKRLEKLVSAWTHRLASIDNNQKHYLAKKLPVRLQYLKTLKRAESIVEDLQAMVGRQRIGVTRTTKSGADRVLFMCSHNQAAALRKMADGKTFRANQKIKGEDNFGRGLGSGV